MSEIFKEAAESTISTWDQWIGKSMTYGSAGAMTFFGALSSDLVFGALGVGVALAGYLLNRFYKRKEDARASVRARRDQISWEMSMIDRYGEETMVIRYGSNWRKLGNMIRTGTTDFGALADE